ncbi:Uncharacterized protein GBIM_01720, partial [Gryllus bimaculatus]
LLNLQNIVKHLEPDAEGRADVVDALSTMTGIAHHINSMKRRHEHAVRVQEIQSLLYGWEGEDLTTFGELCAEGAFRLAGAKALRHAFLFDRMLLITKKKEEGVLSYKAHIKCSNLMLIESVPGEPLSFHVIPFDNPRLQYTLRARNLEQKREWALQLKRVIIENYNAVIPSHARRLVMELGQNRTDDEILADKTPPRRQHSAPEYLEKRKQERERRKSETGLRHRLRRQRKSDTGLSAGEQSPSSPRRHRRASSSSRERSHSRDGLRSVSPAAIKGEASPQLALLPERSSSPAAIQCGVETPSSEQAAPVPSEDLQSPSSSPASSISASTREVPNSGSCGSCADGSEQPTAGQRSLEEIVGQLLLQNHEFQKMLKRQQRRQQMRTHHRTVSNSATAETSDTETEADDGAYESLTLPVTLTPPPKMKTDQLLQDDEEQESDYVTLAAPNGGSASSSRRSGDYDNLQQIWESVRRQQEEIRRLAEREGVGERDCDDNEELSLQANESIATPSLRRAQSFCTSGTPSTPHSSTASTTNTAASLEALDSAPTAPAVWLRQQGAHLATPSKKSGSLPRSFQLAHGFGTAAAILAGTGRPFTIASDPPSEINFEDIERYMAQAAANGNGARHAFPLAPTSPANAAGDTTEDESLPEAATPAASLRELNVHPEHKIYRPAAARAALRQVVVNVSARLTAGLRASSEALDDTSNDNNQQNNSGNTSSDSRRVSRRIMSAFRHYSKTRLRLHSFVGEESPVVPGESTPSAAATHRTPPPPTPPPPPPVTVGGQQLPIYKQGSSRLGARIALCSSDYANPQQLLNHLPSSRPQEARPDSVLSASSAFTSSSDGERPPQLPPGPMCDELPTVTTNGTREDPPLSDGSADSYYERSFEAIESLLENDVFRDSAVFSDHDDNDTPEIPVPVTKTCPRKVPPPVPAKPDMLKCRFIHVAVPSQTDVREKSRVLAETAARSLAARTNGKLSGSESNGIPRGRIQRPTQLMNIENQRRHEEDWESASQHSAASTVVEVVHTPQHLLSDDESNTMQQKGWVKHVIGKLQGPPNGEGQNCRKITSPLYSDVADSG